MPKKSELEEIGQPVLLYSLKMSSYVGFAKRVASSFFPRVVPVPQLQPLDARKIFYSSDEEVWKVTLVWAEASSSDDEWSAFSAWEDTSSSDDAWAAFLAREEAKVQEREAKTVKAATRMKYDIYDPSTWPPYVWPAEPASVRCKKPYDAHLASLLAAPVAPPPKPLPMPIPSPYAAAVDDFGDFGTAIATARVAVGKAIADAEVASNEAWSASEEARVVVERAIVAGVNGAARAVVVRAAEAAAIAASGRAAAAWDAAEKVLEEWKYAEAAQSAF